MPKHKIIYKDIINLIPYVNNSRTHGDDQIVQVASSIKEFGFTNPVLIDSDDGIIAGHGRILAAQKLSMDSVPCIVLSHLTDAQKKAYVIADNKLALNAGWDDDLLSIEISELNEMDFNVDLLGFSDDEMKEIMQSIEITEGLTDEDAVPELPEEPTARRGDVWVLGNHRLMCGDSTSIDAVETLMDGQKADFCFTSPPYNGNTSADRDHQKMKMYLDESMDNKTSNEYIQFNNDIISAIALVSNKDMICCYNINYNKNSPSEYIDVIAAAKKSIKLVETIVWEKQMAISLQGNNMTRIYEFIFVLCNGKFKINKNRTECLKNLWKISNIGANHEKHKACFPVKLVEEGIKNFCKHGGTIIEPFAGTGTTVIAAENMGCRVYMMELDEKYCDVIIKRWEEYTGNTAVLLETDRFNEAV